MSQLRVRRPLRVPEPNPTVRQGSGEPLLLIHPFMLSHEVWSDVVPTLAEDYDVVAATLPGHWGGPHLPRRDVSLDAFADGLEALMDDLGWETAHVAGCSIGGWLSLELAARGRARSVTAIAPAGGWKRFSWTQIKVGLKFLMIAPAAFLGRATGDLARTLPFFLLRPLLAIVSARPERMSRSQRYAFVRATTHCSAFLPFFWSELRRGGIRGLDKVDVPVRLVLCEKDWLLPPEQHGSLFRALKDLDEVTMPGVGHVPMYDDPAAVAVLIAEHVGQVAGNSVQDRGASLAG